MNKGILISLLTFLFVLTGCCFENNTQYSYLDYENLHCDFDEKQTKNFNSNIINERKERIKLLAANSSFHVIVGSPLKIIYGECEMIPVEQEDSEIIITDYYFKVEKWLVGIPKENVIRVRSQVGNIFQLGELYVFASNYNIVFDNFHVNSRNWTLNQTLLRDKEIFEFYEEIQSIERD